jgi:hypothetical protein
LRGSTRFHPKGPSEKTRRTGYFRIQIHTRTSAGVRYLAAIEAQGDPGYAATSVMLGEAGLCLALDRDQLPSRAGVLTPATAMGAALATRLRAAGHTLATRQVTPLRGRHPRPARPALLPVLRVRCARWNAIKKADRASHAARFCTGATAAPGRRQKRSLTSQLS